MANEANIFLSNGTCYSGHHLEANAAMIPCGNDFFGHVPCCQAGDNCLESSVCFNGQFYVTYVAGCSDPEYDDENCPDKFDNGDAPWLGMSYCNGTSDTWILCDQQDRPETIVSPDPCSCPTATDERTMTLVQFSQIKNTASLPIATGLSIAFEPGFYPTFTAPTPTPTASSTSSSTSSQLTTASHTALESPTDTSTTTQSGPHLTSAAVIGTALGAVAFGMLIIGGLGWYLVRRARHKRGPKDEGQESKATPPPGADLSTSADVAHQDEHVGQLPFMDAEAIGVAYGGAGGHESVSRASELSSPRPSELDGKGARPWSMVSELDGGAGVAQRPVSVVVLGSTHPMDAILEQGQCCGLRRDESDDDGVQIGDNSRGYIYRSRDDLPRPRGLGEGRATELPAESIVELPG